MKKIFIAAIAVFLTTPALATDTTTKKQTLPEFEVIVITESANNRPIYTFKSISVPSFSISIKDITPENKRLPKTETEAPALIARNKGSTKN